MAALLPRGLATGWMLGVVDDGLVAIGPEVEAAIDLGDHAVHAASIGAALDGTTTYGSHPPPVGVPIAEFASLVTRLRDMGALRPPEPTPAGTSLATALRQTITPAGPIFTSDELLLLAASLTAQERRRALEAFTAGLSPHGRLAAYVLLAQGRGGVWGDRPGHDALAEGLRRAVGLDAEIVAVGLNGSSETWSVGPGGLDAVGVARPHRLGPVLRVRAPVRLIDGAAEPVLCVAELAHADLAKAVGPGGPPLAQGVGSPERARLVALAEGAERSALSSPGGVPLIRAHRNELTDSIAPSSLFAGDPAVHPNADDASRPWVQANTHDGARRWVPAETVTLTVTDTPRLPWTSSGTAAHRDLVQARQRAICELVERDAFVWTWMQRLSRERIRAVSAPLAASAWREAVARHGWTTTWVDLTLDSFPVVLCALTHDDWGLTVGTACHPVPAEALERATREAAVTALGVPTRGAVLPLPEQVRTPHDHLMLHRDPARRPDHAFLFEGTQEVDLHELADRSEDDLDATLIELGFAPLHVDLSHRRWSPFRVVRTLAPGLLPMTFGHDCLPVGMPRAARPVSVRDGRRLGARLTASELASRLPHPFP